MSGAHKEKTIKLLIYDERRGCVVGFCNTTRPADVRLLNGLVLRTCKADDKHQWLEFPRTAYDELKSQVSDGAAMEAQRELKVMETTANGGTNTLSNVMPEFDIFEALLQVERMEHENGCTEEGCGCPGSQLHQLNERLKKEFPRNSDGTLIVEAQGERCPTCNGSKDDRRLQTWAGLEGVFCSNDWHDAAERAEGGRRNETRK